MANSSPCEPVSQDGMYKVYVEHVSCIINNVLRNIIMLSFRIEILDKVCRELKILYLQSNLIPKIGKCKICTMNE